VRRKLTQRRNQRRTGTRSAQVTLFSPKLRRSSVLKNSSIVQRIDPAEEKVKGQAIEKLRNLSSEGKWSCGRRETTTVVGWVLEEIWAIRFSPRHVEEHVEKGD
jgi:hypothetical protein